MKKLWLANYHLMIRYFRGVICICCCAYFYEKLFEVVIFGISLIVRLGCVYFVTQSLLLK